MCWPSPHKRRLGCVLGLRGMDTSRADEGGWRGQHECLDRAVPKTCLAACQSFGNIFLGHPVSISTELCVSHGKVKAWSGVSGVFAGHAFRSRNCFSCFLNVLGSRSALRDELLPGNCFSIQLSGLLCLCSLRWLFSEAVTCASKRLAVHPDL